MSWNYDSQFERAYSVYTKNNKITDARNGLRFVSKMTEIQPSVDKFAFIKLNGNCGVHNQMQISEFSSEFFSTDNRNEIASVYATYAHLTQPFSKLESTISFAWEPSNQNPEDLINKVAIATSQTTILIVIGYSFPYFNKEIERKIFRSMSQLEKIYIQSPDAKLLCDKIESLGDVSKIKLILIEVDDTQFFLPPEL